MAGPAGTLHRHERFHSAFLEHDRDVIVWTPPGYDVLHEGSTQEFSAEAQSEQASACIPALNVRYPVLYLHDGQNLFDPETSYQPGEYWRVGETAGELIAAGRIEPLMIVGIYNSGSPRIHEYTPTADARLGGGRADLYGRMIVEELKPFIDVTYRTRPDRLNTGIGGSSLGALVSLHLAFAHPQVFGKVAVLSPSVWWGRRAILRTVRQAHPRPQLRLWVDTGTAEGTRGLDDARLLKAALVGAGWTAGVDLRYAEREGATHNETAWAERVGPMLEWLFPTKEPASFLRDT